MASAKSSISQIIGIDPGKSGGICIIDREGKIIKVVKTPETAKDLFDFLKQNSENSYCFLEKVQGRPKMAGMFEFGRNFGYIEMALLATNIPTLTVIPQKWQKFYSIGNKGEGTSSEWKNKLKQKAQQLFPDIKITLDVSDAILIAEYGRQELK